MSATLTSHRRPVEVARRLPVAVAFAVAVLERAPKRIIGSRLGPVWTGPASLSERILDGARVTRAVLIGVGPLMEDEDALVLPVWWEDAEPPLGTLGRFADGLAGHKVVIASLEALLEDIVVRLAEGAADAWLDPR